MTSNISEVDHTHPLLSELSSLRDAVARFQAWSSDIITSSATAHDRATYLERENNVLRNELIILRDQPHPDTAPQAHPVVTQVQQLTLSLRRLSDKLSLTEAALLERTTQLTHATAEVNKAKLTAEAAYELAARTRGREEAGKLREVELEWKVREAEEAAKMSDLVVKEYADLVRSLERDQPRNSLSDSLAEGKLGLQRLLSEFSAEMMRLQKELLEGQGALAAAEAQNDSEKKHLEQCRAELAQAQFELQQLKINDNTAAKMVSRYMKFSQKSTDTLSEALLSLKTRHAATTSTLSSQILSLSAQLQTSETQAETLRRALDELGGELVKESYGRRREVALRIRMVNREEKIRAELERWVLRAEEVASRDGAEAVDVMKMVGSARAVLEGTLGGDEGTTGRWVVAEAAVRELTMELEMETVRRLDLEKMVAEVGHGPGNGDDHSPEPPESSPADRSAPNAISRPTIHFEAAEPRPQPPPPPPAAVLSTQDDFAPTPHNPKDNGAESPSQVPSIPPLSFEDEPHDNHEHAKEEVVTAEPGDEVPKPPASAPPFIPDEEVVSVPMADPVTTMSQTLSTSVATDAAVSSTLEVSSTFSSSMSTDDTSESLRVENHDHSLVSQDLALSEQNAQGVTSSLVSSVLEALSPLPPRDDIVSFEVEILPPGPNAIAADSNPPSSPFLSSGSHKHIPDKDEEELLDSYLLLSTNGAAHHQDPSLDGNDEKAASDHVEEHNELESYIIPQVDDTSISRITEVSGDAIGKHTSLGDEESDDVFPKGHLNLDDESSSASPALEPTIPSSATSVDDTQSSHSHTSQPKITPTLPPATKLPPSIVVPSPTMTVLDTHTHPLLAELAKGKHRYDTLQRSLRDCHFALETLSTSLSAPTETARHIPAEALKMAVQRLIDYTEDARVELEIRVADEELVVRGYETLLSVPGALATSVSFNHSEDIEHDHDAMTHSDVERQVEAFVNGTDASVSKAMRSLTRKLEDIEHDIAAVKRAIHDDSEEYLSPPTPGNDTGAGSGGGWTSWIRSTPVSPASPPPAAPGPAPTFGSVMSSPRLRHSPSLSVLGRPGKPTDPLESLGLRVQMPSYIPHQAQPPTMQPRSRTVSTMYMLGLGAGARRMNGPAQGAFVSPVAPSPKRTVSPLITGIRPKDGIEDNDEDSDVE